MRKIILLISLLLIITLLAIVIFQQDSVNQLNKSSIKNNSYSTKEQEINVMENDVLSKTQDNNENDDNLVFFFKNKNELSQFAIEKAIELYDQNPHLGAYFSTSTASTPIHIKNECGKDFEIVILHRNDDISGIVALEYKTDSSVNLGVIQPTAYSSNGMNPEIELIQSNRNRGDKENYPAISSDSALEIVKHIGYIPIQNELPILVLPCAEKYPLTTPTEPFYRIKTTTGTIYINSMTKDIVTTADIKIFKEQNDTIYSQEIKENVHK